MTVMTGQVGMAKHITKMRVRPTARLMVKKQRGEPELTISQKKQNKKMKKGKAKTYSENFPTSNPTVSSKECHH